MYKCLHILCIDTARYPYIVIWFLAFDQIIATTLTGFVNHGGSCAPQILVVCWFISSIIIKYEMASISQQSSELFATINHDEIWWTDKNGSPHNQLTLHFQWPCGCSPQGAPARWLAHKRGTRPAGNPQAQASETPAGRGTCSGSFSTSTVVMVDQ